MGLCLLCEKNQRIGYWYSLCEECTKIQNLMNTYGASKIHLLIDKTLVIQEERLEKRLVINLAELEKKYQEKIKIK